MADLEVTTLSTDDDNIVDSSCHKTESFTKLLDYCKDTSWKDTNSPRKDIWICNDSKNASLYNPVAPGNDVDEVNELSESFKVMSKMHADYISMESSITQKRTVKEEKLPVKPNKLPVLQITEKEWPLYVPKLVNPTVFKEGIVICRDWLVEHFEPREGVSMPRAAMYQLYMDFCQQACMEPINQATFGKAVRSSFEGLKTRRLGMRGHSKYHYYGLCVKNSSPYRESLIANQRLSSDATYRLRKIPNKFSPKQKSAQSSSTDTSNAHCPASTPGAHASVASSGGATQKKTQFAPRLIQGFPTLSTVAIGNEYKLQLAVFLNKYRAHCEEVLQLVLRAEFVRVEHLLFQFWPRERDSLVLLLNAHPVLNVIRLCDHLFFKTMINIVVPSFMESIPEHLIGEIRQFCRDLVYWTKEALHGFPESFVSVKMTSVRTFYETLNRLTCLVQLCQVIKVSLRNHDDSEIAQDWKCLDFCAVARDVAMVCPNQPRVFQFVRKSMCDFERLLAQHSSLQKYIAFAESVFRFCSTAQMSSMDGSDESIVNDKSDARRQFLLRWTCTLQFISRELTNTSAPSFGKLHILGLLLTDYISMLIENERQNAEEARLTVLVRQGSSSDYSECDSSQRRSSFAAKRARASKPSAPTTSAQRRIAVTSSTNVGHKTSQSRAQTNSKYSNIAPATPSPGSAVTAQHCYAATRSQTDDRATSKMQTSLGGATSDERRKSGIRSLLTSVPTPSYSCHVSEQTSSCDLNNNNAVPAPLDCSNVSPPEGALTIDCSVGCDVSTTGSLEQYDASSAQTFNNAGNVIYLTSSNSRKRSSDVGNSGYAFAGGSMRKSDLQSQYERYSLYDGGASEGGVALQEAPGATGERNCFGKRVFSAQELQQKKNSKRIIDNMLMRETLRDIFLSHAGAINGGNSATGSDTPGRSSMSSAASRSGGLKRPRDSVRAESGYSQS